MASFDAWNKTLITATGAVPGLSPGVTGIEFGGIQMAVAGTSTTVTIYDAASATGTPIIPTTASLTLGQFVGGFSSVVGSVASPGAGVRCTIGLWVVVGGTGSPQFYVYWR